MEHAVAPELAIFDHVAPFPRANAHSPSPPRRPVVLRLRCPSTDLAAPEVPSHCISNATRISHLRWRRHNLIRIAAQRHGAASLRCLLSCGRPSGVRRSSKIYSSTTLCDSTLEQVGVVLRNTTRFPLYIMLALVSLYWHIPTYFPFSQLLST